MDMERVIEFLRVFEQKFDASQAMLAKMNSNMKVKVENIEADQGFRGKSGGNTTRSGGSAGP
jgi:hypothetical protein